MIVGALLTVIGILAVTAIAYFWKDISGWLQKVLAKSKDLGFLVIHGMQVLLKGCAAGFKNLSVLYKRLENNMWEKKTIERSSCVDATTLPDDIKIKLQGIRDGQTIDISDNYEAELRKAQR